MIYLRDTSRNGGRKSRWTWGHFLIYWSTPQLSGRVGRFICSPQRYWKQTKKMVELADKLGSCKSFYFHFFFFFFSSLLFFCLTFRRECRCTKSPSMLQITVCCPGFGASLAWAGTSLPTFWSLPTRVCQPKFAMLRPLKTFAESLYIIRQMPDSYNPPHRETLL